MFSGACEWDVPLIAERLKVADKFFPFRQAPSRDDIMGSVCGALWISSFERAVQKTDYFGSSYIYSLLWSQLGVYCLVLRIITGMIGVLQSGSEWFKLRFPTKTWVWIIVEILIITSFDVKSMKDVKVWHGFVGDIPLLYPSELIYSIDLYLHFV